MRGSLRSIGKILAWSNLYGMWKRENIWNEADSGFFDVGFVDFFVVSGFFF
jgi:hypothetical protein